MQFINLFHKTRNAVREILAEMPLLKMRLERGQGKRPTVTLLIPYYWAKAVAAYVAEAVEIHVQGRRVFQGVLKETQKSACGYGQELFFEGGAEDALDFETVLKQTQADPLFYGIEMKQSAKTVLTDTHLVPFFPMEGAATLVSPLEGHQLVTVTDICADSFHVTQVGAPLTEVKTTVQVSWIQEAWGEIDISSKLMRHWPDGVITTFAADSLKKRWFSEKRLGHSGYAVLKSELQVSADHSEDYPVGGRVLTAYAFKPQVVLGWHLKQKRIELCTFSLKAPGAEGFSKNQLDLKLGLQDITLDAQTAGWVPEQRYTVGRQVLYQGQLYRCQKEHVSEANFWSQKECWAHQEQGLAPLSNSAQSVYFPTPRGHDSLSYAKRVAESRLKERWLSREIRCVCPFETGRQLDEDTLVRLQDQRLPGGEAVGKVWRLTHILDAEKNRYQTEVILRCPPAEARPLVSQKKSERFSLWPDEIKTTLTLPEEEAGFLGLSDDHVVCRVEHKNFAPEQWAAVQDQLDGLTKAQQLALMETVPTEIQVHLADLKRAEPLVRIYGEVLPIFLFAFWGSVQALFQGGF